MSLAPQSGISSTYGYMLSITGVPDDHPVNVCGRIGHNTHAAGASVIPPPLHCSAIHVLRVCVCVCLLCQMINGVRETPGSAVALHLLFSTRHSTDVPLIDTLKALSAEGVNITLFLTGDTDVDASLGLPCVLGRMEENRFAGA